ncbi:MAG: Rrf2 family transcriptional regulator [Hyphomicrobiales bacterium]
MRLTKQSSYAVRIVVECAVAGDELTRIAEVAERYGITKHNVAKIVPILVRAGIVEAVRGRSGGIRLLRPASKITVGEIVRASEATMTAEARADEVGGLGDDPSIGRVLDDALEAFITVLDGCTVADLVAARGRPEAGEEGGLTGIARRLPKAIPLRR